MNKPDLQAMRDWADAKIAAGSEPPWAWYQYMKLRETLDAIIESERATIRLVSDDDLDITLPM